VWGTRLESVPRIAPDAEPREDQVVNNALGLCANFDCRHDGLPSSPQYSEADISGL